ncbi:MAG: membrane integrity-associated transporter subunit PqiC [Alphaproteobacteria bacterium]|nr:membrane integrity-associated transporter subunit PqiC [Alphaproteobacteria bacterium]
METQARYALVGMFTLAVIVAGFAFVYWLNNSGGFGRRDVYQVKFTGSVSDLLVGSHVLFNGIRVGEVTRLGIDSEDPRQIVVDVEVDQSTPMRADTSVSMDFQGLTGAPVILFKGGSPEAPALVSSGGKPPLLVAPAGAGDSLTQSARNTLGRLDTILSDNATPLHDAIDSISTFSKALARNSDRVDGIIAGIERMTGAGAAKDKPTLYDLTPARDLKRCESPKLGNLLIPEPTAPLALNSDKILVVGEDPGATSFANAQWVDNVPALVQARLIESFENTGCFRSVSRPLDAIEPDLTLRFEIRNYGIAVAPEPMADIEISAKLIAAKDNALTTSIVHETMPLKSTDSVGAVAAFDIAFAKTAQRLVEWASAGSATEIDGSEK